MSHRKIITVMSNDLQARLTALAKLNNLAAHHRVLNANTIAGWVGEELAAVAKTQRSFQELLDRSEES